MSLENSKLVPREANWSRSSDAFVRLPLWAIKKGPIDGCSKRIGWALPSVTEPVVL